jgi:phosphonate transport system substrate-binding protein
MRHIYLVTSIAFIVIAFFSTASHTAPSPLIIQFGINSTDSPRVIGQKIIPILKALESDLEKRLGQQVQIKFKVFRTYQESIQAFVNGDVDFGRLGPSSYVLAKKQNSKIRLLAMENRKGKKRFWGLIVVHRDRPIQKLSDLKGLTFAFGNKVSTIGRYLSQRELVKAGLCAKDLAKFEYLRRHDNVFSAVELGQYDAGALKESTYHKRNKKNKNLRILHRFPNVTKPWLARAGLDERIFYGLQSAILKLEDTIALKKLKIKGFFPSSHTEYSMVEDAMFKVNEFDRCSFKIKHKEKYQP